ncbi:hypothetical protein [Methylobacterium sp. SD21]|uniref:hypothetical protein n=1 Tax=Methylobacterium litchii TaxID=3138810 RepID=UPI00313C7035
MLKTALTFFGFTPAPPVRRQPSARRVAPSVVPAAAPVAPPVDEAAERRRRNAETAARLRPDPNGRFPLDVAKVARTFDRMSTQPSPEELHLALCRLGPVGEYIRAVHMGGGRVALLPASLHGDRGRTAAYREHLTTLSRTDYEGWIAGLAAYDRAVASAKRTGDAMPEPLTASPEIEAGIAQHAAAKLARMQENLARRKGGQGGTEGTGGGPVGGAAPAAPPMAPTGPKGGDEEEPANDAPAGPRR